MTQKTTTNVTGPVAELDAALDRATAALVDLGRSDGSVKDLFVELTQLRNKAASPTIRDFGAFSGGESGSAVVHRANVDELRGLVDALTRRIEDAA